MIYQINKIRCPKKIRREIATHFKLKNLGLSVKELEVVKLSIQINKQSQKTQGNKLKTPQIATHSPNESHSYSENLYNRSKLNAPVSNETKLGDER